MRGTLTNSKAEMLCVYVEQIILSEWEGFICQQNFLSANAIPLFEQRQKLLG